jgi:flagellum-specific peptidoglycan hydrolase FlgJ
MKKILVLISAMLILSCGSSRVITSKEADKKYNEGVVKTTVPVTSPNTKETTRSTAIIIPKVNETKINTTDKVAIYVHKYKAIAQYEMQKSGVPASITLAQGILESGAGNGDLTKRANNHFGIKCHNWTGEKVYHDDDKKGECFRKYSHPSESFKDHSNFLTSRGRYASLFQLNKKDYKGWAKGLRKAGYATDPKYPSKLISLIERYNLNDYDQVGSVNSTVATTPNQYTIQKGDTLYSVAKKFDLSISDLMNLNNLTGSALNIGQQLIVK